MKGEKGKLEKWRLEELTERIINGCINLHKKLGPGFLENIYHKALEIELRKQGLHFETEKEFEVHYEGHKVGIHRVDLIVEDAVVIELKAVDEIHKKFYGQLRSTLKAAKKQVGLLINFADFKIDVRRVELK